MQEPIFSSTHPSPGISINSPGQEQVEARSLVLGPRRLDALVEHVQQILAGLEGSQTLVGHFDLFPGVGIAAGVSLVFLGLPGAQTADFHPISPHQRVGYGVEERVDNTDGVCQREVEFLGQQKIEITFVHAKWHQGTWGEWILAGGVCPSCSLGWLHGMQVIKGWPVRGAARAAGVDKRD